MIASYFPVFCLGYFYRRLSGILAQVQKTRLSIAAIVSIVACFLLAGIGVEGDDPDQIWVIAAFCLFFLFERVRVPEGVASKVVVWVAKRSYSIYLFQYTTIAIMGGILYTGVAFGDVSTFPLILQLAIWALYAIGSYCLALVIASVLDPILLTNVQRLFNSVFLKKPDRSETGEIAKTV